MSKMFKKDWIKDLVVIDRPFGKVQVKVAFTPTEKNRIRATEPGKSDKYIVNFRAIAKDKLLQLKKAFTGTSGEILDEIPVESTRGLFLTGSIWINGENHEPELPMGGETVATAFDWVPMRDDKSKLVLRQVGGIAIQKSVAIAPVTDVDAFFESLAEIEENEGVLQTADEAIEQTA